MTGRSHSGDPDSDDVATVADDGERDSSALERLEGATDRYELVVERIEREGEDAVERGAEAYRRARTLLDRYEDTATGTGRENFKAYVQLEAQFASLVESLPEDLADREAFEAAWDAIDKRRLSERDFERARQALDPAERYADLVDEREAAREELRDARKTAARRLSTVTDEIDRHERLLELASVDLDAPVDRLRDPVADYNDGVREAFSDYVDSAPASEVFAFLERTRWYPLVAFETPPDDLREYIESSSAGEYAVSRLLEYADYSRSKLAHHVDDPDLLKRRVATRRTYLQRLDAAPLTIDWPPPPAALLRYRIRELVPLVARIADESVVADLRAVRELTADPEYERLRTAAVATDRLSEVDRERLADGRVEADLEALRDERERLQRALEAGTTDDRAG